MSAPSRAAGAPLVSPTGPPPRPFRPWPLTSGGHRQTVLGYWLRGELAWRRPEEDLVVDAGGDVRLLVRASWHAGLREERPALVLVHGLEGSDRATYALATGEAAFDRGWHVARMNMRGVGDGLRHCPQLYNAGLWEDLVAVLRAVAAHAPAVAVAGFSLGGNLTLLALARGGGRLPPGLVGAVAVSPAVDLMASVDAIGRLVNRPYERRFMRDLRASYEARARLRPDLYRPGLAARTRSVRDYDERVTAPCAGYASADDYYARCSAGPELTRITARTLLLAAADDPMVPVASVLRFPLPSTGTVTREVLPTGGHVGFVAPTYAPGRFWAAERILGFLEERIPSSPSP